MHECGFENNTKKKLRTQCEAVGNVESQQPKEDFLETCIDGNLIEKDKKGCEKWKSMPKEERQPYVDQADKLDAAYLKLLREEENEIQLVDEEADSAEVGIYDKSYEDKKMFDYDSQYSYGSGLFLSETYDT